MNASMLPQTLELTVNPSVFYRLSSESSIASVVCHELAHASMRHADQPIKPELRKQLLDSNQKEEQFSLAVKAALAIELVILDEAIVAKIFGDYSDIANQMFLIKYEMQDFIRTRLDAILYGLASPGQQDTQALYISYRYKQYLDLFSKLDDGESVASDYINLLSPDERQVFADFMANLQRIKQEKIGVDPVSGLDITAFDAMQILQGLAVTIDKAYGGIELSFVNWMESEADQVGLEICARAGLDISKFEEFHRLSSNFQSSLLLAQQDSIEACMSLIERGEIPLRSSDTHPTPCSRLFDVRYREPEFHKSQYDQLKARQTQNNPILGETRLEALKRMFE